MRKYERDVADCPCGGNAIYHYAIPVHWVICERSNCPYQMRTKDYVDGEGVYDPIARDKALLEWNRMVREHRECG